MKKYAIEITGYGKRTRYSIKEICSNGTNPVDCKAYRTEADARAAAARLGLGIVAVGDMWEILHAAKA